MNLILAYSSLQLVPDEIKGVIERSKIKKFFKYEILDSNYHYKFMKKLKNKPNFEKMGRPDIVHLALLNALDSLANHKGVLNVYVHTLDDLVIKVDSKVRLPRNYFRFLGVMEQVLKGVNNPFFEVKKMSLEELLNEIKAEKVALLTKEGEKVDKNKLKNFDTFLIGAFPKGKIVVDKRKVMASIKEVRVFDEGLMAWTVTSLIANCLLF